MRIFFRKIIIALISILINTALFLLIPVLQILFGTPGIQKGPPKKVTAVIESDIARPRQKTQKKEIKAIQSLVARKYNPSSPAVRNVQMDLSVVTGGEGVSVESGQIGAMTYMPGETDTEAQITKDCFVDLPLRAKRENMEGYADVLFVVSESGRPIEIEVLREDPPGYGFAKSARSCVNEMRFRPATIKNVAVRQKVSRRIRFGQE